MSWENLQEGILEEFADASASRFVDGVEYDGLVRGALVRLHYLSDERAGSDYRSFHREYLRVQRMDPAKRERENANKRARWRRDTARIVIAPGSTEELDKLRSQQEALIRRLRHLEVAKACLAKRMKDPEYAAKRRAQKAASERRMRVKRKLAKMAAANDHGLHGSVSEAEGEAGRAGDRKRVA